MAFAGREQHAHSELQEVGTWWKFRETDLRGFRGCWRRGEQIAADAVPVAGRGRCRWDQLERVWPTRTLQFDRHRAKVRVRRRELHGEAVAEIGAGARRELRYPEIRYR